MLFLIAPKNSDLKVIVDKTMKNISSDCNVSKTKVELCAQTMIRAYTVRITAGKISNKKFWHVVVGRLVSPRSTSTSCIPPISGCKVQTNDDRHSGIGLSPRLTYDLVLHTAPGV